MLRSALPHTGSPGPFGPGTPKEPEKSPKRVPRGRAPKVPKEVRPGGVKRVRKESKTLTFGLSSDSFETAGRTLWAFLGPCPGIPLFGLFSDSSGVPGPKGPGDPVWGGADRKTGAQTSQQSSRSCSSWPAALGRQPLVNPRFRGHWRQQSRHPCRRLEALRPALTSPATSGGTFLRNLELSGPLPFSTQTLPTEKKIWGN